MNNKKIDREEKFEILTLKELENVQGGENEHIVDIFRKIISELFDNTHNL